jgi:hypothetical protein
MDIEYYINDFKKNIFEFIDEYNNAKTFYDLQTFSAIILKNSRPLYIGLVFIIISILLCIIYF